MISSDILDRYGKYFAIPAAVAIVFSTKLSLYIPAGIFAVLLLAAVFVPKLPIITDTIRFFLAAAFGFAPIVLAVHPLGAGIALGCLAVLLLSMMHTPVSIPVLCGAAVFGILGGFCVFFDSVVFTACFVLILTAVCIYIVFLRWYRLAKNADVKMK